MSAASGFLHISAELICLLGVFRMVDGADRPDAGGDDPSGIGPAGIVQQHLVVGDDRFRLLVEQRQSLVYERTARLDAEKIAGYCPRRPAAGVASLHFCATILHRSIPGRMVRSFLPGIFHIAYFTDTAAFRCWSRSHPCNNRSDTSG